MYINFALNSVNDPGEEPYLTLNEVGVTLEQLQKNLTGNVVLGGLNVLHSLNPYIVPTSNPKHLVINFFFICNTVNIKMNREQGVCIVIFCMFILQKEFKGSDHLQEISTLAHQTSLLLIQVYLRIYVTAHFLRMVWTTLFTYRKSVCDSSSNVHGRTISSTAYF